MENITNWTDLSSSQSESVAPSDPSEKGLNPSLVQEMQVAKSKNLKFEKDIKYWQDKCLTHLLDYQLLNLKFARSSQVEEVYGSPKVETKNFSCETQTEEQLFTLEDFLRLQKKFTDCETALQVTSQKFADWLRQNEILTGENRKIRDLQGEVQDLKWEILVAEDRLKVMEGEKEELWEEVKQGKKELKECKESMEEWWLLKAVIQDKSKENAELKATSEIERNQFLAKISELEEEVNLLKKQLKNSKTKSVKAYTELNRTKANQRYWQNLSKKFEEEFTSYKSTILNPPSKTSKSCQTDPLYLSNTFKSMNKFARPFIMPSNRKPSSDPDSPTETPSNSSSSPSHESQISSLKAALETEKSSYAKLKNIFNDFMTKQKEEITYLKKANERIQSREDQARQESELLKSESKMKDDLYQTLAEQAKEYEWEIIQMQKKVYDREELERKVEELEMVIEEYQVKGEQDQKAKEIEVKGHNDGRLQEVKKVKASMSVKDE